jgi:hypothetical protein
MENFYIYKEVEQLAGLSQEDRAKATVQVTFA